MVSKLLIDVDDSRQPVLSIKGFRSAVESDDVRDKLVRGFVENVGSQNGLASIYFDDAGDVSIKPAALDMLLYSVRDRFDYGSKEHNLLSSVISLYLGITDMDSGVTGSESE